MKNTLTLLWLIITSIFLLMGCPQATDPDGSAGGNTGTTEPPTRPRINPEGGFHPEGDLEIEITSSSGAEIYYTNDGSKPSTDDIKYKGPFTITIVDNEETEIRAIAVRSGLTSREASETFGFEGDQEIVLDPTFSITDINQNPISTDENGDYPEDTSDIIITLSIETVNANIYYTSDGSIPSKASTLYTNPIELNLTQGSYIVKAVGIKNNAEDSAIVEIPLSRKGAPKAPEILTKIDDFYDPTTLVRKNTTLSIKEQPDITIEYSLDNGVNYVVYNPNDKPALTIPVGGGNITVKTKAIKTNFSDATSTVTYNINTTPLAAPTISAGDFYDANGDKQNASVSISGASGATFFYSASAADANPSTEYSTPFALAFPSEDTKDFSVKAIARKIGETESDITETITFKKRTLEAPVIETDASDFFVNGMLVTQPVPVVIKGPANASITYRLGTTGNYVQYDANNKPTLAAEAGEKTISAIATRDGYINGEASTTFEVGALGNAPTPTIHNTASQFKSGDYAVEDVELNITIPAGSDANAVISYKIGDSGSYTPYDAANKPVIPFKVGTTKIYARVALHGYSTVDVQKDITINSFGKLTAPNIGNTNDSFYTGTGSAGTRKSGVSINLSHKLFGKATIYYRIGPRGDYKVYTTTNRPIIAFENSPNPDSITVYTRVELLGYEPAEGSKTFTPRTLATPTLTTEKDLVLGQTVTPSNAATYGSDYSVSVKVGNTTHNAGSSTKTLFDYKSAITSASVSVTATVSKPGFSNSTATKNYSLPTTYYVVNNSDSLQHGTLKNPLRKVQDAVDLITQINNNLTEYTLVLQGGLAGPVEIDESDNNTLKIHLKNYSGPGSTTPVISSSSNTALTVSGSKTHVRTSHVQYNNSERGIYIKDGATVTMEHGRITDNSGTGVSVSSRSTFNQNNGFIERNDGGGVSVSGTFNLNAGSITDNTKSGNGGGVNVSGEFNLKSGIIERNSASKGGGVFYSTYADVTITGGSVTNNTNINTSQANNIQGEHHTNAISFNGSSYNTVQLGFTASDQDHTWQFLDSVNNIFSGSSWKAFITSDQGYSLKSEYSNSLKRYRLYYEP